MYQLDEILELQKTNNYETIIVCYDDDLSLDDLSKKEFEINLTQSTNFKNDLLDAIDKIEEIGQELCDPEAFIDEYYHTYKGKEGNSLVISIKIWEKEGPDMCHLQ